MNATQFSRTHRVAALSRLVVTEEDCIAFARNFDRFLGTWDILQSTPACDDPDLDTLEQEHQDKFGSRPGALASLPALEVRETARFSSLRLECGT